MQGELVYAVPWLAVLGFVGVGSFVMWFAFTCPAVARPFLLAGGSVLVLLPYVALMVDLAKYPRAFVWWDAFLLPAYCIFLPEAYASAGTVTGLVLPCLIMLLATALVPAVWFLHFSRRNRELRSPDAPEKSA